MRHLKRTAKLGRTGEHRNAMLANLVCSLIKHKRVQTTLAKAKAARVSALAVQEGVQMHGGIGMTDEHDIGLYMKREAVLSELFGSPRYHAGRVAELSGY